MAAIHSIVSGGVKGKKRARMTKTTFLENFVIFRCESDGSRWSRREGFVALAWEAAELFLLLNLGATVVLFTATNGFTANPCTPQPKNKTIRFHASWQECEDQGGAWGTKYQTIFGRTFRCVCDTLSDWCRLIPRQAEAHQGVHGRLLLNLQSI